MGKRKHSSLRGLSQFAFALKEDALPSNATLNDDGNDGEHNEFPRPSEFINVDDAVFSSPQVPFTFKRSLVPPSSLNNHTVETPSSSLQPAKKKRKTNKGAVTQNDFNSEIEYPEGWIHKYGATNLGIEHYADISYVPEDLRKYFFQRYRLFSLYSSPPGCLLDREGWYSITPEAIATQIAERCRCDTILDAFCGVGGNAIAFAQTCERVIALDTSPTRLALARHNAQIYGVAGRIEFVLSDYLSFARAYFQLPARQQTIDVVFLSPPWGGLSYLSSPTKKDYPSSNSPVINARTVAESDGDKLLDLGYVEYGLESIQPIHGKALFDLTRRITKNVAYYLPRNTRLEEVSALLSSEVKGKEKAVDSSSSSSSSNSDSDSDDSTSTSSAASSTSDHITPKEKNSERIEVEEEWMGNKLKALTCYFGGLVKGQEAMF